MNFMNGFRIDRFFDEFGIENPFTKSRFKKHIQRWEK